jgi:hypothetical protein
MATGIGQGAKGWKESGKAVLNTMLDFVEKQVLLADVEGVIQTIFGNPASLLEIFAIHAGIAVAKAGVNAFPRGGDFVTSGPQMIVVGDNPGGRERVQVTPMSSPNYNGPSGGGGLTIHFNVAPGAVVDEPAVVRVLESAARGGYFDNAFALKRTLSRQN